jgi:hypothetical protein
LIAVGILTLIVFALVRMRDRGLAWMLGAALLYILLFNLRYALIDGRTYSLSSVLSANELILYVAATAAIALVISWLVFSLGYKVFKQGPAQAANLVLDWILATLALLAIAVLWNFVVNGILVTWRLPEFLSMFLGFISLLQILLVSVVGLLLTGITSLAAWLRNR